MTSGREALVLIDLQRDYFADDELERCREDLVAACNDLVRAARASGVPVIEVRTVHDPGGSTWTMSMREDGQGMALDGTSGAEPVEGLQTEGARLVTKTRDSAFFGTDLLDVLGEESVDHLVLCGVSTESCVAATAIEAFAHDLAVTFVSDATASVDRDLHDDTLAQLADRYRQQVRTAAEVEKRWANR
ncbi:cysteine hydrolase family protein [Nocardioides sp. cx-173]|uniref:cysteine hydrolase family protein n=1 Tax=Nocardioides sp. cx-173 TaxID=2898796 RepID=UPI001E528D44|nr:isochorismatase family cysteine hydrolase [Nocardioides sp. cx-173]MCD4523547.1 cysteine hydrolase [Nocardioides sp. cx-173]UGB42115.1 cysteine hydrolase [Nocardioides sp. cx-173]